MAELATPYRTHTCNELKLGDIGISVCLAGWVHRVRDHGGLIFVDLRDHYGTTQVVFSSDTDKLSLEAARSLRPESVIFVQGRVAARRPDKVNRNMATGDIEVVASKLTIDTLVTSLPFPIDDDAKLPEELRLTYRFLDLRRDSLHGNIIFRARVIAAIREYLHSRRFIEFQTPILTVSSPEGARDYLVPSRVHPGKFYALPQAPQQYKQLIMCSGFDRYFQIAPCFRDEDARADRTPGEFYQLDLEMSFVTQEEIFEVIEGLFEHLGHTVTSMKVSIPFPRIRYREALDIYGSDKPDIRFDLKIQDLTGIFVGSAFKTFADNTTAGRCVKALRIPGAGNAQRSFFDQLDSIAKELGAKGLVYISNRADGLKSTVLKFLSDDEIQGLKSQLHLEPGDAAILCAGEWLATCKVMGQLRKHLAKELKLVPENVLALCWIVDFPMYEWNDQEQKIDFSHNPFSMPQGGLDALRTQDPLTILAYQYDLVCNGVELSSGAIRNHQPEVMYKAFEIVGYSRAEVDAKFGHMIKAFTYGAPPHGGIAPGVDRIVMILANAVNIREVIMFPMNQTAQELMVGSPSTVTPAQLKELHLAILP